MSHARHPLGVADRQGSNRQFNKLIVGYGARARLGLAFSRGQEKRKQQRNQPPATGPTLAPFAPRAVQHDDRFLYQEHFGVRAQLTQPLNFTGVSPLLDAWL